MKIKHLLTIPLAVFLSACTNPNNDVPIQSNGDGYDNTDYQNQYQPITTTDALAVGAVGVVTGATVGAVTGYAVGKYANKPRYGKPVVVVNKHYYQTNGSRTKYKSTYRKRK